MDFALNEEQVQFQQVARDFARNEIIPKSEHFDRTAEFPQEIVAKARELGFTALNVPVEYGGAGLGATEITIVAEELAFGCAGIATAITLNTLVADAIAIAANEAQQKKAYEALARGHGAYC